MGRVGGKGEEKENPIVEKDGNKQAKRARGIREVKVLHTGKDDHTKALHYFLPRKRGIKNENGDGEERMKGHEWTGKKCK